MTDHSALIERLEAGPHEWGYRCPVEGVFFADNAPLEAAAALRDLTEWRDISTAPKDGTVIVAWGKPCLSATEGPYVSRWEAYGHGSMARELWLRGEGPEGRFWHVEPVSNWTNSWDPTYWLPLPSAPNQAKEAGE